ncbi:uncharacterized protein OCT59_004398 [Rhizophagus irregularis]|nr:hypothetical protein RirG_246670 [Rhizophagus irregularis DAOM 197198w]UZO12890.1 hypothetical protein OCT59_004398 [Rhizophagus irregularis]
MDTSKQNTNIIENNSKIGAKNLWKSVESEYQFHATIFSTESDETSFIFKKVNIMDLEKRKEVYGVCG